MATTVTVYNKHKQKILAGTTPVVPTTDTIKVALLTSSYAPNYDTHDFYDDITNELTTTGGYTAGGVTLTGVAVGLDTAGDFGYIDFDDAVWAALTATFRYALVYKSTGTPSTSPLIELIDFGANETPAGVPFVLQWAAAASGGLLKAA